MSYPTVKVKTYKLHHLEHVPTKGLTTPSVCRLAVFGGWLYLSDHGGSTFIADPSVEIEE